MAAQILTPKVAIFLIGLLVVLMWYLSTRSSSIEVKPTSDSMAINAVQVPAFVIEGASNTKRLAAKKNGIAKTDEQKSAMKEGVFLSTDKMRVSIYLRNIQRLMVVQRLAEVAGFDFSLPDNAVEFWVEPITVTIDDKPIVAALADVIGNKNFTLEMSYEPVLGAHKISAVFLADSKTQHVALSPIGKNQPLPQEKNDMDAPGISFSTTNEQQLKRENFFTVDEQSRLAILREMSPVGDDLRYIVASLKQDKSAQVRAIAAQRLSFSENYGATQSLIEALTDKDPAVVQVAVDSLVSLGDSSVIPAMEARLGSSENSKALIQEASRRIQSRFTLAADAMR